ncbi:MAG: hypothetical protein ACREA9_17480 [Pyrinomonadaceae bacterium]
MGSKRIEVKAGDQYGRLTVIREVEPLLRQNGWLRRRVECRCECGTTATTLLDSLRKGQTQSCGCLHRERAKGHPCTHGHARKNDPLRVLYRVWSGMIGRCETPSAGGYDRYGGRGIGVCDEWRRDPAAFIAWALLNGWQRGMHIDRINNDGNYCPGNCRFVPPKANARNKRSNRAITFNGETLLLVEWAEKLGIPYDALNQRINILKWPIERALTEPVRARRASCRE